MPITCLISKPESVWFLMVLFPLFDWAAFEEKEKAVNGLPSRVSYVH